MFFARKFIDAIVEPILDDVDVDRLARRLDVDRVVDRVDVTAAAKRVRIDEAVDPAEVDALLKKLEPEIGGLISRSTIGVVAHVLDVTRSHLVSIDQRLEELVSPPSEQASGARATGWTGVDIQRDRHQQRTPAGAATRTLAFALDGLILSAGFALLFVLTRFLLGLLKGSSIDLSAHDPWVGAGFALLALVYFALPWSVAGRTLGMAVLGLQVQVAGADRPPTEVDVTIGRAVIRFVALALGLVLMGLGLFVGTESGALGQMESNIVARNEAWLFAVGAVYTLVGLGIGLRARSHRCLHDRIAHTVVVYRWDVRGAELRLRIWRERMEGDEPLVTAG